jgi:hypothetical protein
LIHEDGFNGTRAFIRVGGAMMTTDRLGGGRGVLDPPGAGNGYYSKGTRRKGSETQTEMTPRMFPLLFIKLVIMYGSCAV